MISANAMLVHGKINTFPQGESSDEVSVPVSILREILSELQDLKAYRSEIQKLREKIDRLEANQKKENQSSSSNQDEEPVQKASVPEPKQRDNAKTIFLDTKKREDTKEIQVLSEIARLEAAHEKDLERLSLEIAYDRQRIAKLEKREPQPLQRDRGKILRALIASSGGKILAKQARQVMHLDKATFSRLLGTLSDFVAKNVYSLDRRQRVLVLG
jgi:flagellar biosynthesis/type III secretory pathway M-ring protein FliF/YscJ